MKVLNSLKLQINLQTGWTFSLRYKSAYTVFFQPLARGYEPMVLRVSFNC